VAGQVSPPALVSHRDYGLQSVTERVETRHAVVAMLVLTAVTGLVDAVSYLALDRVFTANMTGNVVLLGFGFGGFRGGSTVGSAVALVAFLVGALFGGLVAHRLGDRESRPRRLLTMGLGAESVILAAATVVAMLGGAGTLAGRLAVTVLLAVAMGLQTAIARMSGVADLNTTVVTMMITGLVAESPLAGGTGPRWPRRAVAVLLLVGGAALGAVLTLVHPGWPLLLATAMCVGLATASRILPV
jgi:uncharacterized membrane protein YoaK (UPF0700 family)